MSQGKFKFGKQLSPGPELKRRMYHERNLRCARIILADRAKCGKPDARFMNAHALNLFDKRKRNMR